MLRISNYSVPLDESGSIEQLAAKRLKVSPETLKKVVILRKGIDARRYHGAPLFFVYALRVSFVDDGVEQKCLRRFRRDRNITSEKEPPKVQIPSVPRTGKDKHPIIVGFGPAGMFAALTLARAGQEPWIFERGQDIDTRHKDVTAFWSGGRFLTQSNVQFGEGGAGTFSDGKLTTRIHDAHMQSILEDFIRFGAPEEIRYLHKPHIGTDLLRIVVKNLRQEILRLGGKIHFQSQVTDIELSSAGELQSIAVEGIGRVPANSVFFGIGHSARDTYAMLLEKGLSMEPKAFAIGVRIEHPQAFIDHAQYGDDAGNPKLPAADYALTFQDKETGRGCYSFCMCPGGTVVAAASEPGRVVTNGMSDFQRDSGVANSALLVQVSPKDFGSGVLDGIAFQRRYEALAFQLAGADYSAPVQSVGDFLQNTVGEYAFSLEPSYLPGVKVCDLHACLPEFVTQTLAHALPAFDRKIPGFAAAGIPMTGIETRSSAPVRILRDRKTFMSTRIRGLYPIGEGAGYAGGIMSAAVDGVRAAEAFLMNKKDNR